MLWSKANRPTNAAFQPDQGPSSASVGATIQIATSDHQAAAQANVHAKTRRRRRRRGEARQGSHEQADDATEREGGQTTGRAGISTGSVPQEDGRERREEERAREEGTG